jgi:hypothetical protein
VPPDWRKERIRRSPTTSTQVRTGSLARRGPLTTLNGNGGSDVKVRSTCADGLDRRRCVVEVGSHPVRPSPKKADSSGAMAVKLLVTGASGILAPQSELGGHTPKLGPISAGARPHGDSKVGSSRRTAIFGCPALTAGVTNSAFISPVCCPPCQPVLVGSPPWPSLDRGRHHRPRRSTGLAAEGEKPPTSRSQGAARETPSGLERASRSCAATGSSIPSPIQQLTKRKWATP